MPTERRHCCTDPSKLLLTLATLLVWLLCLPTLSPAQDKKNLLILNSYSPGYQWTDDIVTGISDVIRQSKKRVRIHEEFMDTKRVADQRYFQLLYETYRHKFKGSRFDVVITSDNDAFDFVLQHRNQLFPGTPVVFCGVNDFEPAQLHGEKLVTGVNEGADIKATLDLALKLHPKTRRIVVINDTTTTGQAVHRHLVKLLPAYQGRVDFTFLEEVEMSEILATVQKLESDALVLFLFFSRDKAGNRFDSDQSISLIAQHCPVPIYGTWGFNLGYGMVGGMLTSGYYQGTTAGKLALRVLNGESADRIPFVMVSPNRYMFDYRQLQRFNIDRRRLPLGSIVINRPANEWTVQGWLVRGATATLILLVLVIIWLLLKMVLEKRRKERLRQLNEELEERVRERTEDLRQNQTALEQQNRVLQDTYRGLQVETEERIRVMEELREKDRLLMHQSRMAAMGDILGNIAHHWRQPLNVLGLYIQELPLCYSAGELSQELLDANVVKMMQLLDHLSRTIDDFRNITTADTEATHFKVREAITKTLSLLMDAFSDQGITIDFSVEGEGDWEVAGRYNEFAQVLINIVMNARDALLERAVADPLITVRVWTEEGRTAVTITDNAGGIDESILERIFDPYFTTKPQGKGTGVGLFISKKIIESNMRGRLTARNVSDGVEFKIVV